ncbi:bifunctional 2-polyprenyl-6-hydroxyphenol methylase/3-demethylubiquinol 3-O-methyltransferase UbiG [Nostoc sp. UCD121]|nr:class I SAM-dependent methyltransferase [Nostoc sp. UCD121]
MRILDLGCLEGLYSIGLALHGATVVGIEGREVNFQKAKFAKECLGLNNLEFIQDDVLNLSPEKYGYFDIVLCCGILYHLNVPEVFNFIEKLGEVCTAFTIIDTHFGEPEKIFIHKGKQYWGSLYHEFDEDATIEQKADSLWASLHNNNSFWFTPYSLFNLLQTSSFTSVYQSFIPIPSQQENRFVLLAHKGEQIETKSRECKNGVLEYPF